MVKYYIPYLNVPLPSKMTGMIFEDFNREELSEAEKILDDVRSIGKEAKMMRVCREAFWDANRKRKELTDPSPFNNASRAIDMVIAEKKAAENLTDEDVTALYNYLNKELLEILAGPEAKMGRTDWRVPPRES